MKKTLHIDEKLLAAAKVACGALTDTDTVRQGLEALVRHAVYQRLRALQGSEMGAVDVPRRRERARRSPRLERGEVGGHDLIEGELLIGDSWGRGRLLDGYRLMYRVPPIPHRDVVASGRLVSMDGELGGPTPTYRPRR